MLGEIPSMHQLHVVPDQHRCRGQLAHAGDRELPGGDLGAEPGQLVGQPRRGRQAAGGPHPATGELVGGEPRDHTGQPIDLRDHRDRPGGGSAHPQHPAPEATASALAAGAQHPPAAGGVNASAGSPRNPPVPLIVLCVPIMYLPE